MHEDKTGVGMFNLRRGCLSLHRGLSVNVPIRRTAHCIMLLCVCACVRACVCVCVCVCVVSYCFCDTGVSSFVLFCFLYFVILQQNGCSHVRVHDSIIQLYTVKSLIQIVVNPHNT